VRRDNERQLALHLDAPGRTQGPVFEGVGMRPETREEFDAGLGARLRQELRHPTADGG
jgi:hypothetical protein